MSSKGRPEGEYRSAQREGPAIRSKGRPEGECRSAQREGGQTSAPRIAVVGGGWAGCAAAIAIADAGLDVELFEAAPALGGRARRVTRAGFKLDNGQHLVLGAYRATRALLARLHVTPPVTWRPLALASFASGQRDALALATWRLPAPLHLLMAILCARGLRIDERIATVRWFARLRRAGYRCDPLLTVAQLTASLPPIVATQLWHPLCIAALNTPPARASAQVFANVLRAAFGEGADGADVMLPASDLGVLVADATLRRLQADGHTVELKAAATIAEARAGHVTIDVHGVTCRYAGVIVAVGPHQLSRAIAPSLIARERTIGNAIDQVDRLAWEPITTAYLGYAQHVELPEGLIRLDDRPGQWLFARPDIVASAGADAPPVAMMVAVVLSTHGTYDTLAHEVLAATVDAQLRACRANWPPLAWSQVIEEKRATYACTPTATRPVAGMLGPGIALAGDYTDDEFPATLEAAVRSGQRAAAALMATLR
ncbi:MAG: hydroxysqualene dehydroxylase HpnE [Betaproteobacteria bacterium]